MRIFKFLLYTIIANCTTLLSATSITIQPSDAVIILPGKADPVKNFAAQELQYHLQLITDSKIKILSDEAKTKVRFYIGIIPPKDKKSLQTEEARWQIFPDGRIYLYGEDNCVKKNNLFATLQASRKGTLYAVYDFLNNVLNVRHLEPGENGISYSKQRTLTLPITSNNWRSCLEFRGIRGGIPPLEQIRKYDIPKDFIPTAEEYQKWVHDVNLWVIRQRFGARKRLHYGHAFTKWWKSYGKTHPEFFAMNNSGERIPPEAGPEGIQLCMSNPAVADFIYEQWKKHKSPCINLCPNDFTFFCQCPECRKLGSKSDMIVYLMNKVMEKATADRPDVRCTSYAYLDYIHGPKKIKVPPSAVIGFVSIFLNLPKMEQYYREWQKMGTKAIFLRPNTFWVDVGLPLGYEKEVFKEFMLGRKYNVVGTDISSLPGTWASSGIATYILARAHIQPEKPFEYWEDEYYSSYGPAKENVRRYYQHIRKNIWDQRVMNNIPLDHMYDNLSYYIVPGIKKIVTEKDYVEAGRFLDGIDLTKLNEQEKRRVYLLQLENRHAILTVRAIHADRHANVKANRELLEFRRKYRNELNIFWPNLFQVEKKSDLTGMKAAAELRDFSYARELPQRWYFEMDPKNIGLSEKWFLHSFSRIQNTWTLVPVTCPWESFSTVQKVPAELVRLLTKYDGIGWYSTRIQIDKALNGKKIYLRFGAVDESCQVFVNGKLTGEHLFLKPNDWKTPFNIDITDCISWEKPECLIIVRVEDKSGLGGIWKPVWLVAK